MKIVLVTADNIRFPCDIPDGSKPEWQRIVYRHSYGSMGFTEDQDVENIPPLSTRIYRFWGEYDGEARIYREVSIHPRWAMALKQFKEVMDRLYPNGRDLYL